MSKGKVYHHEEIEEEEEEDIDLGFEEEEELVVSVPYKKPQTDDQYEINRLTSKVAELKQEIKRIKKELERANESSEHWADAWADVSNDLISLRRKQEKQVPEFIALLTNTGKSEFTLDWLKKTILKKK